MSIISEQIVETTWKEISGYPQDYFESELVRFEKKQPCLFSFLTEFTQDQVEPTIERFFFICYVIYRIFENGSSRAIQKVSNRQIESAFEKNEALIENMQQAHDRLFQRILKVQFCSQPFVMKYVVEALIGDTDTDNGFNEFESGFLFFLLKTVMDVLDEAAFLNSYIHPD